MKDIKMVAVSESGKAIEFCHNGWMELNVLSGQFVRDMMNGVHFAFGNEAYSLHEGYSLEMSYTDGGRTYYLWEMRFGHLRNFSLSELDATPQWYRRLDALGHAMHVDVHFMDNAEKSNFILKGFRLPLSVLQDYFPNDWESGRFLGIGKDRWIWKHSSLIMDIHLVGVSKHGHSFEFECDKSSIGPLFDTSEEYVEALLGMASKLFDGDDYSLKGKYEESKGTIKMVWEVSYSEDGNWHKETVYDEWAVGIEDWSGYSIRNYKAVPSLNYTLTMHTKTGNDSIKLNGIGLRDALRAIFTIQSIDCVEYGGLKIYRNEYEESGYQDA